MAGQKFTLSFDAQLNVGQMKGAISQIQSTLNGLHLPANITKDLQATFNKLSEEVKNFETLSNKDITGKADFSKLAKSAEKVVDLFNKLKTQVGDLGASSNSQLEKMFPENVTKNIQAATAALTEFNNKVNKTNGDIKKAQSDVDKYTRAISQEKAKTVVGKDEYDQITEGLRAAEAEITDYKNKLAELNAQQAELESKLTQPGKSSTYRNLIKEISEVQQKLQTAEQVANNFAQQKVSTTTFEKHTKDLANLESKLTEAQGRLESFKTALDQLESTGEGGGLKELLSLIGQLTGLDMSKFSADAAGAGEALRQYFGQSLQQLRSDLNGTKEALEEEGAALNSNKADVDACANSYQQFEERMRDVSALKSRIQYFFGLNNAINLVKRAIRGAFDTIKDLDKAMTETAVVTDFTVSDMWGQLPEYTKRANELGVTTQAAYEAATLYYQQGLNFNEVNALSVETLKMARIAGLDAAEATDRMTNALRGFNMALDEESARRVDDVYSELAANTASNVDEISTAMTKVASLAHNANMEFETTAAFLSQIIETTRESAETAGTALKTVVARFSEVKKLVDEGQLRGTDEEGQAIDVNKVGAALRTAGIDLNKYFLGEVGLDDIFMELASKWDTLTNVQQRYIATQAAGSRQQSRFIALMQDYARTQELVDKAYNAEGASARQFAKTQESLQSKLARLSNAWNEFLMGLTNNQVVKGFVDLLTNLLNALNSLTSAFGEGTGSILKWIAAISAFNGIKALFRGGGFVDKLLMTALSGTGLGNAAIQSGLLSGLLFGGEKVAGLTGEQSKRAEALQNQRGLSIYGGIGNIGKALGAGFTKLGTKALANQAGIFGKIGGRVGGAIGGLTGASLDTTVMLGGIATAFTAVATAVTVAFLAYKAWLNFTPEGKLKKATKQAEELKKQAEESQKELDSLNNLEDTYKEKTEQVTNATTVEDRAKAVEERNKAILDAIEEDKTLAQYVITERTEFGIELTINEEALSNAIEKISKEAQEAAIASQYGEASVDYAQAQVYKKQLERIYAQGNHGNEYQEWGANPTAEDYWTAIYNTPFQLRSEEEIANAAKIYQDYLSSLSAAQKQIEIAYGQELTYKGASKDLTNALMPILGEAFTQAEKKLTSSQLDELLKLDESTTIAISEAFSGLSDFYDENLLNVESIDFGFTTDELEAFASVIGISREEIEKQIKSQIEQNKLIQKQKKTNIYSAALANGISLPINSEFVNNVANLSPKLAEKISDIITSATDSLSKEGMAQLIPELLGMDEESLTQFSDFFANFDLNDPINAFHQLNQAKEEALSLPDDNFGNAYRQMLNNIDKANASIFDTGNLVQTFLTSTSYDSLTDSIQDFIKANGKLTADNIEELADSCADLQNLLEDTTATAQGLAAAFSLFENGEAPIDALTSSLIAALSAGEDFETLISNVSKWIEDFDEGTDLKEGTEHIGELAEKATDYIYNWEFGNEPLANIYDHIFGEGAYNEYMKNNWGKTPIEEIETKLQGDIDRVKSLAEKEGRGALDELINNPLTGQLKGEITEQDGWYTWNLDAYDSANDAIQDVANNLGVAEDAARAFIEAWASHMWDMGQAWNELNFDDKIKAFSDELGQNNIITQQQLDILSKNTGKTSEEILNAVNELRSGTEKPITIKVDWTNGKGQNLSGDDLLREAKNVLDQLGSSYDKLTEKFAVRRYIDSGPPTNLGINYSELSNYLTDSLKLSDSQAKEVANDIASQTGKNLTQDIQVPIRLNDGSIELQTKTIAAKTAEELQSQIEATQLQAQFDNLARTLLDTFTNIPEVEITYNEVNRPDPIPNQTVIISYKELNKPSGTGGGTTRAAGGIVSSYAKGSENIHIKPGTALTGEEGPEIVWNKNKGYAYITGSDGPEFQDLKPGDRVFNASETKRIFKNSSAANGGKVKSFANESSGPWNNRLPRNEKGGADNQKEKTSDEWKNELDWLYNLMEDIVELERDQKKFEEEFEDILTDDAKTSKDLYNLLIQRLGNLNVQLDRQTLAFQKREQEMREFMDTTNDQDQYLWYNWSDRTLEIDWDAIDQIVDGELYKHVKDLISEAEEIQGKMDDAEDAIQDIKNQIQELENIWRDTYVDFEKRVLDALVKSYQQVIDNYSTLNDTINNSNNEILEAIQHEIDLERQIRDNTETEQDISDKEARLAYLQRDTTGANAQEILRLQKELDTNRQDYEDSLVDQAIQRLQEDNDEAAKQRDKQIEIMQAQLDYQKENGEFNDYISNLISSALSPDGTLLTTSELYELLNEQENWEAMSATNKQIWEEELNTTFKEVGAFLLKDYADWTGKFYTDVANAINTISDEYKISVGSYSQAKAGNETTNNSSGGGGDASKDTSKGTSKGNNDLNKTTANVQKIADTIAEAAIKTANALTQALTTAPKKGGGGAKRTNMAYATGGLNTQTGLAWLDGTPSEPEYVLNARQTQAFLKLAEVLPAAMNGGVPINNGYGGDIYLNLDMHVDEIADDYDVDRIANRVKDILYDASSYRNVNTINFIR